MIIQKEGTYWNGEYSLSIDYKYYYSPENHFTSADGELEIIEVSIDGTIITGFFNEFVDLEKFEEEIIDFAMSQ